MFLLVVWKLELESKSMNLVKISLRKLIILRRSLIRKLMYLMFKQETCLRLNKLRFMASRRFFRIRIRKSNESLSHNSQIDIFLNLKS